ncbi:hypothetical protein NKL07_01645 [Mesorhizobium sp. C280B]|uniref:hypothetical protein n=1 Tax=unclassified Mesorhizobium TaxID=325217 RepID=UPI0003F606B9|nr:hypothetical protein [Mesorhizobium sp. LSJC280B00]
MPPYAYRPAVKPEMRAVVERWLAVRRLTLRPNTIYHRELSLRRFLEYLAAAAPAIVASPRAFFIRIRDKRGKHVAAVATARKLAVIGFSTRTSTTSDDAPCRIEGVSNYLMAA